jgi:tRNA threonylcarbamoyladenosine biosynthesis protein TsaE
MMKKKLIREWKKVFESDLGYISFELKETVNKPAVILLEGAMGSGKTTFAKAFIDRPEETMSPSYSVVYEAGNVVHADLYRIEDAQDIIPLELALYLENKQFLLAEWGVKYVNTLIKELPEEFSFYLLDISVNDNVHTDTSQKAIFARNFNLYEILPL